MTAATLHTGYVSPEVLADLQRRTRGMSPEMKAEYLWNCPEFPRPVFEDVEGVGLVAFVHSAERSDIEYPTAIDERGYRHCPCVATDPEGKRAFVCWHQPFGNRAEDARQLLIRMEEQRRTDERKRRQLARERAAEKARDMSVVERRGRSKVFRMAESLPPSGLSEKELEEDAWSRLS